MWLAHFLGISCAIIICILVVFLAMHNWFRPMMEARMSGVEELVAESANVANAHLATMDANVKREQRCVSDLRDCVTKITVLKTKIGDLNDKIKDLSAKIPKP
jgi:hypothetical protein